MFFSPFPFYPFQQMGVKKDVSYPLIVQRCCNNSLCNFIKFIERNLNPTCKHLWTVFWSKSYHYGIFVILYIFCLNFFIYIFFLFPNIFIYSVYYYINEQKWSSQIFLSRHKLVACFLTMKPKMASFYFCEWKNIQRIMMKNFFDGVKAIYRRWDDDILERIKKKGSVISCISRFQ